MVRLGFSPLGYWGRVVSETVGRTVPRVDAHRLLLRLSLALATVGGFGSGLAIMAAQFWPAALAGPWLAVGQAHGQVQTLGFVALFIFGVALQLFPAFLLVPMRGAGQVGAGGSLLALGLVCRFVASWLAVSPGHTVLLWLAAGLELAGVVVVLLALARLARGSVQRRAAWLAYPAFGFASLAAALVLNLALTPSLAAAPLLARPLDEALVHLELWGFAVPICLGVSMKIFPRFLILRPPHERAFWPVLAVYGLGVYAVTAGWLATVEPALLPLGAGLRAAGAVLQVGALAGLVGALRLFEPAARASGKPLVTNPTRRWFRLAYAALLLAAGLGAWFAVVAAVQASDPTGPEQTAVRHALAQGFLLPLIVGMAIRILPGYSAIMPRHPRVVEVLLDTLLVGAALRVAGELARGEVWAAPVAALGGALGTAGFLVFAATLWRNVEPLKVRDTLRASRCPRRVV